MMTRAVELLRQAAEELRQPAGCFLVIPKTDPADGPYPLGLRPGRYRLTEVAHAVSFVADMLEA